MTKRCLLEKINTKVFPSGKNKISGRDIVPKITTGAPAMAANLGALCWNVYDSKAYICTVVSGTWVELTA